MRDEGDRFVAWRLDDARATPETDPEQERMERALLAYAHRSAARVGAEWFAAEFARREEEDRLQEARAAQRSAARHEPDRDLVPEITLIDSSVENAVVGGAPTSLGLEPRAAEPEPHLQPEAPQPVIREAAAEPVTPDPPIRHPHVPRPPAPEPPSRSKPRRWRRERAEAPTPSFVISAPEWARMSPGARRLYWLDTPPPAAGTGWA